MVSIDTNPPDSDPARPPLALVDAAFAGEAALGTGVSAAILRRVARGDLPTTMRIHRTGRILAFGRIDRLSAGYSGALEIARDHGYEPIERMAGGRAAVFHEGTLAFSRASREPSLRSGTAERFRLIAEILTGALRRLGVDARIGEVPGEYCPGEWSVNWAGRAKLAGIGQRVVAGGAHVGGVLVFRGGDRSATSSFRSIANSGSTGSRTAGSVEEALGSDPAPAGGEDPLLAGMIEAMRLRSSPSATVSSPPSSTPETLRLAEELRGFHTPKPRDGRRKPDRGSTAG